MCTVSFIARRNGYVLGMNRDERLSRVAGQPPEQHHLGACRALYPSEPGGGTWIGVNEVGVTYALINWYSVSARVMGQAVSRGEVVKALLPASLISAASEALAGLPLKRINPFRLVAIIPTTRAVVEWRWNLARLEESAHPWQNSTWISSGFDEPGAQQSRGKTFGEALLQSSTGSLDWLRRMHRSHSPERGPYSTCMHRHDAATVSYTEVAVAPGSARMRYIAGPPCCTPGGTNHQLKLHWHNRGSNPRMASESDLATGSSAKLIPR